MGKKHDFYIKKSYLNNRGVTMVAAIVIMAILVVFTFSLTLIAYTLYSSQNKNVANMRCAEAANTLSVALENELRYVNDGDDKYPEKDSFLYRYLRYNLCQDDVTWPYYISEGVDGHDKTAAYRYFDLRYNEAKKQRVTPANGGASTVETVDGIEGLPGRTIVCIYWKLPDDSSLTKDQTAKEKLKNKNGIKLYVEVTCEAASQSYTVKKEYILKTSSYPASETARSNYLNSALTHNGNVFTNPCNFTETDIKPTEKWEWIKSYEE